MWLILQLISSVLLWISIKSALNTWMDSVSFSVIVFIIWSIIIWLYGLFTKSFKFKNISKSDIWKILFVWFIIGWVWNVITFIAYDYTTLTNMTFLTQSNVIFSVIIWMFLFKEKRYFKEWLIIWVLFLWLYLFATSGSSLKLGFWDTLVIIAAILSSFFVAWSQIIVKNVETITYSFIRSVLVAVFIIIYAFLTNKLTINLDYSWVVLCWVLLAFAVISLNKALTTTSASQMSIVNLLIPIITWISSYFLFWDKLTFIQIIWAWMIVFSVFGLQMFRVKHALKEIVEETV